MNPCASKLSENLPSTSSPLKPDLHPQDEFSDLSLTKEEYVIKLRKLEKCLRSLDKVEEITKRKLMETKAESDSSHYEEKREEFFSKIPWRKLVDYLFLMIKSLNFKGIDPTVFHHQKNATYEEFFQILCKEETYREYKEDIEVLFVSKNRAQFPNVMAVYKVKQVIKFVYDSKKLSPWLNKDIDLYQSKSANFCWNIS